MASSSSNVTLERLAINNQREAQAYTAKEHADAIKQQGFVKAASTNAEKQKENFS